MPDVAQDELPLVSLLLVTYQQVDYAPAALGALLAQTYPALDIVVSDDGSRDGTFEALEAVVRGAARPVRLLPRTARTGLVGNLNRGVAACSGELIVVAAGDDLSDVHRVECLAELWLTRGKRSACLSSTARVIDQRGQDLGPYMRHAPSGPVSAHDIVTTLSGVLGCAAAWTSDLFDVFGPLDTSISREDVIIPFRAALLGEVYCTDEQLVSYRLHEQNLHFARSSGMTGRELVDGQRKHARGNIAVVAQMERDLALARARGLVDDQTARSLLPSLDLARASAQLEAGLLESQGLPRLPLLLRAVTRRGIPRRRRLRWLLSFGAPWAYALARRLQQQD